VHRAKRRKIASSFGERENMAEMERSGKEKWGTREISLGDFCLGILN
jgi:hypothetical protein